MKFKELTDEQWEYIRAFIPPPAKTGRPRIDDRKVINGILWVLITRSRWQDMPRRYCYPTTAWRRLKEFERKGKGIWEKVLRGLLNKGYESGKLKLERVAIGYTTTIEAKKWGR